VRFKRQKRLLKRAKGEIEDKIKDVLNSTEKEYKIEEVVDITSGQSPKSEFYNELSEGLSFYQGKKEFGDIYLKNPQIWTTQITKVSYKDDILISVRAPVGDVNINPFDKICIGRGLASLRVKKGKVLSKFLFYFIKFNKSLFAGHKGSTFNSISRNELAYIKIPIPPLSKQKALIDEVEILEAKIDQAKTIIEGAKERKEKVMEKYL